LTQPQGHSTSGSHERYKSKERLAWETEFDCVAQMRQWMLSNNIATEEELSELETTAKKDVLDGKKAAWTAFTAPIKAEQQELVALLNTIATSSANKVFIEKYANDLAAIKEPIRKDIITTARKILRLVIGENGQSQLATWITNYTHKIQPKFSSHLFSQSDKNVFSVQEVKPTYDETAEEVDARLVLRDNFDAIFAKYPETLIF